jgi:hypothetical protein
MRKGILGSLLALAGLLTAGNTASAQAYYGSHYMPYSYGSYYHPYTYGYSYPYSGTPVYSTPGTVISSGSSYYPSGTVVTPSSEIITSGYTSGYTPYSGVTTSGYSVPYVGSMSYPSWGTGTGYSSWGSGYSMPYYSGYSSSYYGGGYGRGGLLGRRWR